MRGLLSFYRGLHTLSNRQARRKAGIVGSRCGFCGTQSNSKVRFELLLRLGSGKQCVVGHRQYFVTGPDFFFFLTMYHIDVAYSVACNFVRCGCAGMDETTGDLTSGITADVAYCLFSSPHEKNNR